MNVRRIVHFVLIMVKEFKFARHAKRVSDLMKTDYVKIAKIRP